MREVSSGWLIRVIHLNGASLFFLAIYLHIAKAMYYSGFLLRKTWVVGVLILLLSMAIAFFGYILPFAQMSYWAAVVITSLLSVLPGGSTLLLWVWGGYSVGSSILRLCYTLHFLLPLVLLCLVVLHLLTLHEKGSTSILTYSGPMIKVSFWPYYVIKDTYCLVWFTLFLIVVIQYPFYLSDPEIFIEANKLVSPAHIVPEWYFCWAYSILRAIPSKTLGALALVASLLVLLLYLLLSDIYYSFTNITDLLVNSLIVSVLLLMWLGGCPAEEPYVGVSLVVSSLYFLLHGVLLLFIHLSSLFFDPE